MDGIRLKQVGWTNARRFGHVWLAWQLWQRLGLDEIVTHHVPATRHTCRPVDFVAIEVINRLCAPCSEFALANFLRPFFFDDRILFVDNYSLSYGRLNDDPNGPHDPKPQIPLVRSNGRGPRTE
jgi:hypothetical protein